MDRAWGPSLVEDLRWGGAAMWIGGDALMAALALSVIARWIHSSGEGNDLGPWLEAARRSALTDAYASEELRVETDIDNDNEALHHYNAMLARLAVSDQTTSD